MKKRDYLIKLSSKHAQAGPSPNGSRYTKVLKNQIYIADDERAFVSVRNVGIPYEFYQIAEPNNTFYINQGANINITIPEGSYSPTQMVQALNLVLTGLYQLTFSYNTASGLYTVRNTNTSPTFIGLQNTLALTLGFPELAFVGINGEFISTFFPKRNIINYVNIHTDLMTQNIENENGITTEIESVLCNGSVGQILAYYVENAKFHSLLQAKSISSIEVWVTDQDNNEINFVGEEPWTLTLLIEIESKI